MNSDAGAGRFAPSPTGRMHLGNLFAALMSWLSARKQGLRWILRIENLDSDRSKPEYEELIEDDLHWLGLDWDEGGREGKGDHGPYRQSERGEIYAEYMRRLRATGLTYPCRCTRADIMVAGAPHASDGRTIYSGRCRPEKLPWHEPEDVPDVCCLPDRRCSRRIYMPDAEIEFCDGVAGLQRVNPAEECGDLILRRADGGWAYQLAVVVDDALMGVTEVVRGGDLLTSAACQIYLYYLLRLPAPRFAHVPLICNEMGQRLSKRDKSMSMDQLRLRYSAEEITGRLAWLGGLISSPEPVAARELVAEFDFGKLPKADKIIVPQSF